MVSLEHLKSSNNRGADDHRVTFPDEITVTLVVCSKECRAIDLSVNNEIKICEYCGYVMNPVMNSRCYEICTNEE